ncbi:hypothetical protein OROMI_002651 [Orobanche minor]
MEGAPAICVKGAPAVAALPVGGGGDADAVTWPETLRSSLITFVVSGFTASVNANPRVKRSRECKRTTLCFCKAPFNVTLWRAYQSMILKELQEGSILDLEADEKKLIEVDYFKEKMEDEPPFQGARNVF